MRRGIGTAVVAKLALVAEINDPLLFIPGEARGLVLVPIDGVEEGRERWAKVEAQPAAVADIEDAVDFAPQVLLIPVLLGMNIVHPLVLGAISTVR
jgi:hypothetical protein